MQQHQAWQFRRSAFYYHLVIHPVPMIQKYEIQISQNNILNKRLVQFFFSNSFKVFQEILTDGTYGDLIKSDFTIFKWNSKYLHKVGRSFN